jgi:hypothetical protein
MDKITNYEEVTVSVDGIDYMVSFVATELWHGVDNGIGHYEYWGAPGVHEQWEWEFDNIIDIEDIVLHEYMNEFDKQYDYSASELDKEFLKKLIVSCMKYARDNAEEPDENPETYDRYSHIDPESYWEDRERDNDYLRWSDYKDY